MFFTKLFLVLALVMLAGQQLSADSANDFAQDPNDVPAPSSTTRPQAPSSSASPPVAPSSTSNDAQSDRVPAADQPIDANESPTCDTPGVKANYVNYVLVSTWDVYVGSGPVSSPLQHLKIVAIIAHLKAANEKPIYDTPGTAKYTKLADSLLAGEKILLTKLERVYSTRCEANVYKTLLCRGLIDLEVMPNLNNDVPLPEIDTAFTPELFKEAKTYATQLFLKAWKHHKQQFDWKTLEADMSSTILKFKQSPFYTFESIEAKDVEIWVLSGMETVEK